jgi:hypothetical protein
MRLWLLFAALAVAAPGCGGDCAQSSNIQVAIAPNPDVQVQYVTRLHVTLSIDSGVPRSRDIDLHGLLPGDAAFLLQPDPPPADSYLVSLTVTAMSTEGQLVGIGAESQPVVSKGCNRLVVHLAAVPYAPPEPALDMSGAPPPDLSGLPPPGDMGNCLGGTPDEDGDGRANYCDLCPADPDPTPVDSDGDALPDACDPDPTKAGNRTLYFDPFDSASGHWSGNNDLSQSTQEGGFMVVDSNGPDVSLSNNMPDALPLNVRVQASIYPRGFYDFRYLVDTGIYLGTRANPGDPKATGVLCQLSYRGGDGNDTIDIYEVDNGTIHNRSSQPLQFSPTLYRMRLTQRGSSWTCEAQADNIGPQTVTATQMVTAPLYMSLRAENVQVHVHSVVAETALP